MRDTLLGACRTERHAIQDMEPDHRGLGSGEAIEELIERHRQAAGLFLCPGDLGQRLQQRDARGGAGGIEGAVAEREGIAGALLRSPRDVDQAAVIPQPVLQGAVDVGLEERRRRGRIADPAGLSDQGVGSFCRERGLYPKQVARWRQAAEDANGPNAPSMADQRDLQRKNQELIRQNKKLERELQMKEKALAEAAALLMLSKKLDQLWPPDEGH